MDSIGADSSLQFHHISVQIKIRTNMGRKKGCCLPVQKTKHHRRYFKFVYQTILVGNAR